MSFMSLIIISWFVLLAFFRLSLSGALVSSFRKSHSSPNAVPLEWPMITVIMALRGGDETLEETLQRLMTLDYPNYRLRIVVDTNNDPSLEIVEEAIVQTGNSLTEILTPPERRLSCSGKISSLLFATEELPINCEVVAVFDGDAVLHKDCLKQLVQPLLEGDAVLTTGNRWYAPPPTFGGITRSLWNGLAVSMMNSLNIPWGGCMVMNIDVIQNRELRNRLSTAFGEDSTIATFLIEKGEKVLFVPKATILNTEDCSLVSFYHFLLRQYLTVRLNNPRWKFVFISNLTLGISAAVANLFILIPGPHWNGLAIGYSVFVAALCIEIFTGMYLVQRHKKLSGHAPVQLKFLHFVIFPVSLLAMNYVNLLATVHATFVKHHLWRGVTYRFPGQKRCEIIDVQDLSLPVAGEAVELAVNAEA